MKKENTKNAKKGPKIVKIQCTKKNTTPKHAENIKHKKKSENANHEKYKKI